MTSQQAATLRTRLRQDLRDDHDQLDGLMSQADLTIPQGLGRFLLAQALGFRAIRDRLDPCDPPRYADMVDAVLDALARDLGALGQKVTARKGEFAGNLLAGPAVDYMVLGSGMGTQVLRRTWQTSSDATVRSIGAFFGVERPVANWTALTEDLSRQPADDARADTITADARRIFGFFREGWFDAARQVPFSHASPMTSQGAYPQ